MEVPRLWVVLELQLPAYTTATAMPDPSRVWDLYRSSWQCWILNSLNKAKDQTCIFMDNSQVCYHRATMETPNPEFISSKICQGWKQNQNYLRHSGLSIRCCHCRGSGHCCDMGLIPGLGTSTWRKYGQKKFFLNNKIKGISRCDSRNKSNQEPWESIPWERTPWESISCSLINSHC